MKKSAPSDLYKSLGADFLCKFSIDFLSCEYTLENILPIITWTHMNSHVVGIFT